MKVDRVRSVVAEEVVIGGEPYLRLVAPSSGIVVWYMAEAFGWIALGRENYGEHEAAYLLYKEAQ